jgi:hypothetical protein
MQGCQPGSAERDDPVQFERSLLHGVHQKIEKKKTVVHGRYDESGDDNCCGKNDRFYNLRQISSQCVKNFQSCVKAT